MSEALKEQQQEKEVLNTPPPKNATSPKTEKDVDDDTASASSSPGGAGGPTATDWGDGDEEEEDFDAMDMPLWHYARVPTVASTDNITCRALAQFDVSPTAGAADTNNEVGSAATSHADIWASQPQTVVALGTSEGTIQLIGGVTGQIWLEPQNIREHNQTTKEPITHLSWDATGTVLSAMDRGGTCAIFEFEWKPTTTTITTTRTPSTATAVTESPTATTTSASHDQSRSQQQSNDNNIFSSWMSALTGVPPPEEEQRQQESSSSSQQQTEEAQSPQETTVVTRVPTLKANILQVSRITYPASFGRPSCMVIDPAYKTKRSDKSVIVGWHDGRLVMTNKKEGLFGRRNDVVVFQSTCPIEAVAWRGPMVAFADATGIKLFDIVHLTRIAHIDRPAGARPTLYPTVNYLAPTILFDSPNTVLVAWGDCLLCMTIHQQQAPLRTSRGDDRSAIPRRTVECSMAWELEGIACGVTPLDATHVLVFTLVPPLVQEGEQLGEEDDDEEDLNNDVQVQVVSRQTGNIVYCDSLPISRPDVASGASSSSAAVIPVDDASLFRLHSSFAMSRVDTPNALADAGNSDASPFSPLPTMSPTDPQRKVVDAHRQWNLHSVLYSTTDEKSKSDGAAAVGDGDDSSSVDSDDYGFVTRPAEADEMETMVQQQGVRSPSIPPVLWITTPQDCLLVQASTVDDAITHALEFQKKPALALRRGLLHKRQLRRYFISDLVNEYLGAVLLLNSRGDDDKKTLSLRRMKLAIDAMPVLMGGHAELWELWIDRLESTIPGALFLLKDVIPVRDPVLPSNIYEQMLVKMLTEIDNMQRKDGDGDVKTQEMLQHEAQNHFLNALIAWGPTKVLKEFIKLYKYVRHQHQKSSPDNKNEMTKGDDEASRLVKTTESCLQRRYLQTAAGYLNFPVALASDQYDNTTGNQSSINDAQDSLFDVGSLFQRVAPQAPMMLLPSEQIVEAEGTTSSIPENSRASLETMARVRMMQGRYDLALTCYLAIGAMYSPKSISDFQAEALNIIHVDNGEVEGPKHSEPLLIDQSSFEFVLGLIESHHLHGILMKESIKLLSKPETGDNDNLDEKCFMPLFALMRLVGLERLGDFLLEHCVAPASDSTAPAEEDEDDNDDDSEAKDEGTAITEASVERRETLPLDAIADLLKPSPIFLHWYLHLLLTRKQDLYVKFPNTANPPSSVTNLHRLHFELYVKYADANERDSAKSLSGTDIYKLESKTTPLLKFLKAALPLGGVRPVEARRLLEAQQSSKEITTDEETKEASNSESHTFSLELAYIIEHYSELDETEAKHILDLYLEGANSIMLAVSFVQRHSEYSAVLWDKLIDYCLTHKAPGGNEKDGMLFGSLLEAAALSGADLARLVKRIPPGMVVVGLRPRLVAAVADYRHKLDIVEAATRAASADRVALLREITHRSRRGVRYQLPTVKKPKNSSKLKSSADQSKSADDDRHPKTLPKGLRTVMRNDRFSLSFSLPMV